MNSECVATDVQRFERPKDEQSSFNLPRLVCKKRQRAVAHLDAHGIRDYEISGSPDPIIYDTT